MVILLCGNVARMMLEDFGAESGGVHMEINLGGGNAFVSEHHLDGAEVGPAFEEVCGE